jgi:lysozyme family protein
MTAFDEVIDFVLENEGGLSENPNDSGGITNFGISYRFLREMPAERLRRYGIFSAVNEQTIRDLTIGQAKMVYRDEFWEQAPFEKIENQTLAMYVFDMAVSHGIRQAVKLVQRSVWAIRRSRGCLKDDGILGEKTLRELNEHPLAITMVLIATRASFYRLIVEKHPKNREFLDGWLNRCYRI